MNFLKTFADHLRALLTFTQSQEENKQEIKRLRLEVQHLSEALRLSILQNQHDRETDRLEREKFMLQVELELARRLPPKTDN